MSIRWIQLNAFHARVRLECDKQSRQKMNCFSCCQRTCYDWYNICVRSEYNVNLACAGTAGGRTETESLDALRATARSSDCNGDGRILIPTTWNFGSRRCGSAKSNRLNSKRAIRCQGGFAGGNGFDSCDNGGGSCDTNSDW